MAMTEEARIELIGERLAAHDPTKQEYLTLPWRDGRERFPVIQLELEATVLSPFSHRIRAQLESDPRAEIVRTDPFSEEAQDAIAEILRETGENFQDLKQNLADDGQLQFGVVTRAGLLVNANRRAVALRDIGRSYIDVAVLPADTTTAEINDLELTLQMQRDFWEEYTFTNRLLFVDDLINVQNRSGEEVARALNPAISRDEKSVRRGVEKVDQDTRVLVMLREIQERGDNRLPLTSFDEQEVALEELDTKVNDLRKENPTAASELLQVRLLGILSNVPYRRLRYLDGEVLEDYVIPSLAASELFADVVPALGLMESSEDETPAEPDGLDVLGDADGTEAGSAVPDDVQKISALVDLLASTYEDDPVELPTEEGPRRLEREEVCKGLRSVLTEAAAEIEIDRRRDSRLLRPANLVEDADRKLRAATDAYAGVKDDGEFDSATLRDALDRVGVRVESLQAELDATA
ncbi:MAG: hypothetical protein JWO14_1655 [Solirubrobacterales bacterium]|nr:hypothetical protein [Solirubrobacterales bacterium]